MRTGHLICLDVDQAQSKLFELRVILRQIEAQLNMGLERITDCGWGVASNVIFFISVCFFVGEG